MTDTVSRVESIMAFYSGFTQFMENAVPSLARSFLRACGKAARSCFTCRENWEDFCSLPGSPRDSSWVPQLQLESKGIRWGRCFWIQIHQTWQEERSKRSRGGITEAVALQTYCNPDELSFADYSWHEKHRGPLAKKLFEITPKIENFQFVAVCCTGDTEQGICISWAVKV